MAWELGNLDIAGVDRSEYYNEVCSKCGAGGEREREGGSGRPSKPHMLLGGETAYADEERGGTREERENGVPPPIMVYV